MEAYQRFGGKYHLRVQGLRLDQAYLAACFAYASILKMEALRSSETSVNFYQTTQRHILKAGAFKEELD
jgi:hypothetical protein